MKSRKSMFLLRAAALAVLAVSASSQAEDAAQQGPNGGVLLESRTHQVEVAVDPPTKKVRVFVSRSGEMLPPAIGITFTDSGGKRTTLELQAMDLAKETVLYQGALKSGAQSYVGFELRIPLKRDRPLVLRSGELPVK